MISTMLCEQRIQMSEACSLLPVLPLQKSGRENFDLWTSQLRRTAERVDQLNSGAMMLRSVVCLAHSYAALRTMLQAVHLIQLLRNILVLLVLHRWTAH